MKGRSRGKRGRREEKEGREEKKGITVENQSGILERSVARK